jgi:hypothetical protein
MTQEELIIMESGVCMGSIEKATVIDAVDSFASVKVAMIMENAGKIGVRIVYTCPLSDDPNEQHIIIFTGADMGFLFESVQNSLQRKKQSNSENEGLT